MVSGFLTFGIAPFIWAFLYNKHYTLELIEKGYVFDDSVSKEMLARVKLGMILKP